MMNDHHRGYSVERSATVTVIPNLDSFSQSIFEPRVRHQRTILLVRFLERLKGDSKLNKQQR